MSVIPTVEGLSIYSDISKQKRRYDLSAKFQRLFNQNYEFIARAPGRVNIIGEHIDYCHFSVLPMAIEVDVIAAVAASEDETVVIANTNPKFHLQTFSIPRDEQIVIDTYSTTWGDYFKCGVIVAQQYIYQNHPQIREQGIRGLRAIFDGTVPTGGGLSSSAALCIVSTLAILRVNNVEISKEELTRITIYCEHFVGLHSGGMDQCASVFGEDGRLLLILFDPKLSVVPFELPRISPHPIFFITNSMVTANKTDTAPTNYNLRVVEVDVAADLIAHILDLDPVKNSSQKTATLRSVMDAYFVQKMASLPWNGKDINQGIERLLRMLEIVDHVFYETEKSGFTTEMAASALGISHLTFGRRYLSLFPVSYQKLNLYKRCKHVYGEALRVLQMVQLTTTYDGDSNHFFQSMGKLMNESQASTRDYHDASTVECDAMCEIGIRNGSYGSRVTGAGWGGCIVHLTSLDRLETLRNALKSQYYEKRYPELSDEQVGEAMVESRPICGACFVDVQHEWL
ncbi:CIC11C00000003561 [Sungouiella intermedia]|uniref:Galactokinase n=1 Tax=Sungouiella intermedia TaxID=45354 RepID=A0A1L0C4K6_9ASCO|nr:CIC11C00000003561 [[Candida] intermedia]